MRREREKKREKTKKPNNYQHFFLSIDKKLRVFFLWQIIDTRLLFFSFAHLALSLSLLFVCFEIWACIAFNLMERETRCRSFGIGYLVLIRRTSIFTQQVLSTMMMKKNNEKIGERGEENFLLTSSMWWNVAKLFCLMFLVVVLVRWQYRKM